MNDELGRSLRAWRERLSPADAGLGRQPSARTPGLRREEVAAGAGISVNYLVRLEQGRASSPSASVVAALACVLHLSGTEAAQLHQLAGLADPSTRVASRALTPSVQRILERCEDIPVIVIDPAWTVVTGNAMADAYLGASMIGSNVARTRFLRPELVSNEPQDAARFEREIVGDLHRQLALHPDDDALRRLIADLRAGSPTFASLWDQRPAGLLQSSRRTVHHPVVGLITVDCDVLEVAGTDLRIVLWTAQPGSTDASALALLRVAGAETVGSV